MKMFLLQEKKSGCECDGVAIAIVRAASEIDAREIAQHSNSCGTGVTLVDWESALDACYELPLLDGPRGMVANSWFPQHLAG